MSSGRCVAIKMMRRQRKYLGNEELFITREIELLQECDAHPYVVDCLGFLKTTNTAFLMMPVTATDLRAVIKDGPLDAQTTQHFTRQLLSALEFLHSHLIVHRDVKPANLLVAHGDYNKIG
ncbi:unnamed protein product [Hapterophycus canaliculatus]